MRVVLAVCGTKQYFGMPKYFYFLTKHLIQRGVDVEVIVDCKEGVYKVHEVVENVRVKVIGPAASNALTTAFFCWNVGQYLAWKSDFDIFHTCHVIPYFYLLTSDRKPVVFQPFGNELFSLEGKGMNKYYCKLAQPVLRYCGHNADALAMEYEAQRDDMVRWYDNEERMFTLPVGIDVDHIRNLANPFKLDGYRVLAVNSLLPYERMDLLIEAFAIAHAMVPKMRLTIVGTGPEEHRLRSLAERLGVKVSIIGNLPEGTLYGIYSSSDLFVSTSMEEDLQMGILEAEAFGLPIVSTGQKFLIDGNGYVVDGNAESIADTIVEVYKGNQEKMGRRSRGIVEQYDFGKIARIVIKKYEELLQ